MKSISRWLRRQFRAAGTVGAVAVAVAGYSAGAEAQQQPQNIALAQPSVSVSWDRVTRESKTTPTMQLLLTHHFRPNSPLHKPIYDALRGLPMKNVRFLSWQAWPRLGVAELSPPTAKGTSWDFKQIDPQVIPFLEATKGLEPVMDFAAIPRWMFKTKFDVPVPENPDTLVWHYGNISGRPFTGPVELADPSGKQVGEYYARLASWYTKGGFTDENGVYHKSGHHYSIPWWEVMSELDAGLDIKLYTKIYDAIATEVKKVSPDAKFVGYSANCGDGGFHCTPEEFEYFLDPKNHAPGVTVDRISYHSYALPAKGETVNEWQYSFFQHADAFLELMKFTEATRLRLSPTTGVDINEVGCLLPQDMDDLIGGFQSLPPTKYEIPEIFWNACGAYYAYMYAGLTRVGVDVVKASQLYAYPGMFLSVTMLNPETGAPNARYRVLELIAKNFGPGDKLIQTDMGFQKEFFAQAFITKAGKKLLLINKRNRSLDVALKAVGDGMSMQVVDPQTGGQKPRSEVVREGKVTLAPFAVAVLSMQ